MDRYDDGEVIRKSLFDLEKGSGSVTIVDTAERDEELSSVGKNTHNGWVERYDGWYANIGDCGGKIADNHYVANLAIETGDSLEEHESQIAMLIGGTAGAVIGSRGGGHATAVGTAVGGLAGIAIDSAFLKHYDLSGRTFTFQCWDIHSLVEQIRVGAFLSYEPTASAGQAAYANNVPGHLGVGEKYWITSEPHAMIDRIVEKVRARSGYGLEAWNHPLRFQLGVTLLMTLSGVPYIWLYTDHSPDPVISSQLFGLLYFPTVACLASVLLATLD